MGHRAKKLVWRRDKGRCFYCGVRLSWSKKTIDHVIPQSKGGPHRVWNLALACYPCNQEKDDRDPKPIHLDIVLQRKLLHESIVSAGQAIELAKAQGNDDEVERLKATLERIKTAILQDNCDWVGKLPA